MRHCIECHAEITACMGSVHPMDFVALTQNFHHVQYRELCGRCTTFYILTDTTPVWVPQMVPVWDRHCTSA